MFGWFKSERRERRKKVRRDRKHLEERAQRFLKSYLRADEARKPQFYRAVEDISKKCRPALSLNQPDLDDSQIAEAASQAAMQMLLDRIEQLGGNDKIADFVADACATVAVAYPSCRWRLRRGRENAGIRNRCSSSLNDGNVIYRCAKGIAGREIPRHRI
jgi:hypothetical protein